MTNAATRITDTWKTWSQGSVNRRILAAALTVGSMTLVVKLVATVKEMVVARHFGTSDALDAYLIAFAVPSFAISVISLSFNAALVPTYIEVQKRDGQEAAQRLFSSMTMWSTGLLVLVSAVLAAAGPVILPLFGSGFTEAKMKLTLSLFYVLLPVVVMNGLMITWSGILNASERFAAAAIAPMLPSVSIIAVLFLFPRADVHVLAWGMVAGSLMHVAAVAFFLRRLGLDPLPRWHGKTEATRQVIAQYTPMIAGSFMMSSTALVDQSMSTMLGSGSVASLNYANKIVALFTGICVMALGTAVLPYFSKMVSAEDWTGTRRTLKVFSALILKTTIPVTLLLIVLSRPLIGFLYQGGAFSEADTHRVALIQSLLMIQIPFFALGILHVRLISSLKANQILMWGTVVSVIVNIVMNLVLMRWLGVAGIALSTSCVHIVSFCYLRFMLMRRLNAMETRTQKELVLNDA